MVCATSSPIRVGKTLPPSTFNVVMISGIGNLNETREALGLHPYKSFAQLTDDPGTLQALKDTFTDINQVDLWTGGLAEKHVKGGLLGQTFAEIISDQFEALRDGATVVLRKSARQARNQGNQGDVAERHY